MIGAKGRHHLLGRGLHPLAPVLLGDQLAQRDIAECAAIGGLIPFETLKEIPRELLRKGILHPRERRPPISDPHLQILIQLRIQERDLVKGFHHVLRLRCGLPHLGSQFGHVEPRPMHRPNKALRGQPVVGFDNRVLRNREVLGRAPDRRQPLSRRQDASGDIGREVFHDLVDLAHAAGNRPKVCQYRSGYKTKMISASVP